MCVNAQCCNEERTGGVSDGFGLRLLTSLHREECFEITSGSSIYFRASVSVSHIRK